jgi:hypothetical protein
MEEGGSPKDVAVSFELHSSWAYKVVVSVANPNEKQAKWGRIMEVGER